MIAADRFILITKRIPERETYIVRSSIFLAGRQPGWDMSPNYFIFSFFTTVREEVLLVVYFEPLRTNEFNRIVFRPWSSETGY